MAAKPVKTSLANEQAQLLAAARARVDREAFLMKRAVDSENVKDAVRHASLLLHELRTGSLTPKHYYELYMVVFDHLSFLEMFLMVVHKNGTPMPELYQMVQQAGNVLARLYLLITVGSVFIRSKKAPAKDILCDLVEMAKGVQHPLRGLFLRYYLSQKTKDKLPDLRSEYFGHGGTAEDAINFVLQNFTEMTRLWVRMQTSHAVRNRKRRERERQDLRVLVGSNLDRLSQMEGVDRAAYQKTVLPNVLEQVSNSNDKIAQFYIVEALIQAFPDEFHIHTLATLLDACEHLLPEVDVKSIVVTLMTRIAEYGRRCAVERSVASGSLFPESVDAFGILRGFCDRLCRDRAETMTTVAVLELLAGLLDFTTQCFPDNLANVDSVLESAVSAVTAQLAKSAFSPEAAAVAVKLLVLPQEKLSVRVLTLTHYVPLMAKLVHRDRRFIARRLLHAVVHSKTPLTSLDMTSQLLVFLSPVLRDEDGAPPASEDSMEEFESEQIYTAKMLQLIQNESVDELFKVLARVRDHLGRGGTRRISHTLPALLVLTLKLLGRVIALEAEEVRSETTVRKVLQFSHDICTALALSHPELALKLFLQCALAADKVRFSYDFFSQAFALAELLDSQSQVRAMVSIIGALRVCIGCEGESYENLITRAAKMSAKLLQKADQSRTVALCAHLFWRSRTDTAYQRPDQVLQCLRLSLTTADECMPPPVINFVVILNHALQLYEQGCPKVQAKFINGLIVLIRGHVEGLAPGPQRTSIETFFGNTLRHIEHVKISRNAELYADVVT